MLDQGQKPRAEIYTSVRMNDIMDAWSVKICRRKRSRPLN
jgi:hypothetical protein